MGRFGSLGGAKGGFLKVLSGTVLAQIISFLFLPLISRLYSPEDFGALTFITACSLLALPFATLRLDTAMMLPKEEKEVKALLYLSLYSIIGVAIFMGLVIFVLIKYQPDLNSIPYIPIWVVSTIVVTSVFTILSKLTLRKNGYGEVGKRAVAQATGIGSSQTLFAFYPGGGTGLVFGNILGRFIGILPLARFTKEFFGRPLPGMPVKMLREYWRFPLIFAPSSALNSFGAQGPLLFVTSWFGVAYAGILGLADRIIGIPMMLIGNAAGEVFDAEMAKGIREGRKNFTHFYLKISGALSILAFSVGGAFFALGEWLVPFALGDEWILAGTCVKVMSLTVALRLIASPTARVISLFQRSRGMISIDITRSVLMLASMAIIALTNVAFIQAVLLMNTALSVTYAITWLYGYYVVRRESEM